MNRLSKIISDLSFEELKLIQKDLVEGNIEKLINKRINHYEEGGKTICPICHTNIIDTQSDGFTLLFGPKDFRRKATFCATDCLDYFVKNLKNLSEEKVKKGEIYGTSRDDKDI
ncbi:hypothetical protein GOV08_03880 [Candidatus Woesearchaeota archaeon]|nr:hypothetical protein [Candidatus Woesearchaeota archaeon]